MIEEDKLNTLELFGENEFLHKEITRLNNTIDKTIKIIIDYLCTYDYTSGELKNIEGVFVDLLNTLQDEKLGLKGVVFPT